MTAKPWLKAKTAGEAMIKACEFWDADPPPSVLVEWLAKRVIEWHESRRENVSERWEVYCQHKFRGTANAPVKHTDVCCKSGGCKLVKVTRYRRAK